jgi:polyferredoxin
VAYLGFIDSGFLSISQIINTINQGPGFLLSNLPLLLFVTFTAVTTLLWGRVFCSSLCPFGAVQDFITRFSPRRWRRQVSQSIHNKALKLKYFILALIIGTTLAAPEVAIFQYFEPFGTLFFLNGALILWVILVAILAACFVVPRFYCRYACPLGAALAVASLASPLRIRRVPQCTYCIVCERACPTGAIQRDRIDFKECVRCDVCEIKLIEKAGSCQHTMSRIIASTHNGAK